MLRTKSPSTSTSKTTKELEELIRSKEYLIECYKAWIRAIAPEDSEAIFKETESRLKAK